MKNKLIQQISSIPKHSLLLLGIVLFIFVFPLLIHGFASQVLITISYTIMLLSVGSIIEQKTKWLYKLVFVAILLQWITFFITYEDNPIIEIISFSFSLVIFIITTFIMIQQIISSKKVDVTLVLEAIIGYLLIGIIFTLLNVLIILINPSAIGFSSAKPFIGEVIYYSFVTVTTIGYGDISPISQIARSTAILFGLIGQLYLTIVIAFIIGKYLNLKK
ncbi:MAG: two pore domain potassium channel family protein [Bacteroidales bacterium]|nr:two pore domain potassium channel family protein [Bacteroidales bacterium]